LEEFTWRNSLRRNILEEDMLRGRFTLGDSFEKDVLGRRFIWRGFTWGNALGRGFT